MVEHSSRFTIWLLQQLVEHVPAGAEVHWFFDCGPHFRTYTVLGYIADTFVRETGSASNFELLGESHGKGPVDGFFGDLG